MTVSVTVNDSKMDLPAATTVTELIRSMGFERTPCAVEVNRRVVPRSRHAETLLAEGDSIEVVTLVGGG